MGCKHYNKEMEIDEKRFYCGDCNKWIGCEDIIIKDLKGGNKNK